MGACSSAEETRRESIHTQGQADAANPKDYSCVESITAQSNSLPLSKIATLSNRKWDLGTLRLSTIAPCPERGDLLKEVPVLYPLSEHDRDLLGGMMVERRFKPGKVVFCQGESPDGFYIIIRGKAKVLGSPSRSSLHVASPIEGTGLKGLTASKSETGQSPDEKDSPDVAIQGKQGEVKGKTLSVIQIPSSKDAARIVALKSPLPKESAAPLTLTEDDYLAGEEKAGRAENIIVYAELSKGDYFGETALLNNSLRTATVVSVGNGLDESFQVQSKKDRDEQWNVHAEGYVADETVNEIESLKSPREVEAHLRRNELADKYVVDDLAEDLAMLEKRMLKQGASKEAIEQAKEKERKLREPEITGHPVDDGANDLVTLYLCKDLFDSFFRAKMERTKVAEENKKSVISQRFADNIRTKLREHADYGGSKVQFARRRAGITSGCEQDEKGRFRSPEMDRFQFTLEKETEKEKEKEKDKEKGRNKGKNSIGNGNGIENDPIATKKFLLKAVKKNAYLSRLEPMQQLAIVDHMRRIYVSPKTKYIIEQGETGSLLYVLVQTPESLKVLKDGAVVGRIAPGTVFGELALLFNEKRSASVCVPEISPEMTELWAIDRFTFQKISRKVAETTVERVSAFLKHVPLLQPLSQTERYKIAESVEERHFETGAIVVREGEVGNCLYIVVAGSCTAYCMANKDEKGEKVGNNVKNKKEKEKIQKQKTSKAKKGGKKSTSTSTSHSLSLSQQDEENKSTGHHGEEDENHDEVDEVDEDDEDDENDISQETLDESARAFTLTSSLSIANNLQYGTPKTRYSKPGEYFGESAFFVRDNRRQATVVAEEYTVLLKVSREVFSLLLEAPLQDTFLEKIRRYGIYLPQGSKKGKDDTVSHHTEDHDEHDDEDEHDDDHDHDGLDSDKQKQKHISGTTIEWKTVQDADAKYLRQRLTSIISSNEDLLVDDDKNEDKDEQHKNDDKMNRKSKSKRDVHTSAASHALVEKKKEKEDLGLPSWSDLRAKGILGKGSFGTVRLVEDRRNGALFALKTLDKERLVKPSQQNQVANEIRIMKSLHHPFILSLHQTYRSNRHLHMLLPLAGEGDLFGLLRKKQFFSEVQSRFYAGIITMVLGYLHSKDVIYRDLKPENILLWEDGYVKLADLGFAKKMTGNNRTWTVCGTPEYLSPEILSGRGHHKTADWWTLGIFIYEMLASHPPFTDRSQVGIFKAILGGNLRFPSHFSPQVKTLIKELLNPSSSQRLGAGPQGTSRVMSQDWFGLDGIKSSSLHDFGKEHIELKYDAGVGHGSSSSSSASSSSSSSASSNNISFEDAIFQEKERAKVSKLPLDQQSLVRRSMEEAEEHPTTTFFEALRLHRIKAPEWKFESRVTALQRAQQTSGPECGIATCDKEVAEVAANSSIQSLQQQQKQKQHQHQPQQQRAVSMNAGSGGNVVNKNKIDEWDAEFGPKVDGTLRV